MINKEQDFWNFVFSVLFIGFVIILALVLDVGGRIIPTSIPLFDFALIVLASFRIIRLFVYDKITQFIRDFFIEAKSGPIKTVYEILICPWCIGIWAGTVITFFYFLTPIAWFFILILAVSGLASFIQVITNAVGWRAENLKLDAKAKEAK